MLDPDCGCQLAGFASQRRFGGVICVTMRSQRRHATPG